jgi:DNA repair exonuclease SbcCD nuclease subunit
LFDLLYQANDIAKNLNCTAIVQLGDFFHIKAPSRNSHELVRRAMIWAKEAPCPVYIVPGNHDLSNDRLESLSEGQPLGVMLAAEVVRKGHRYLYQPDHTFLPVYGIPWLQFWDAEQSVADKAVKSALSSFVPKDTPQLIVTHAPFFPPGSNPAYEHYSIEKFSGYVNPLGRANVQVAYGHIHDWHGEYVSNGVRFVNYGALSRGSLTESNLTREVGVTIWDSITGKFEFIALQAKPADQVFRVQEITEVKQAQLKLDEFLLSVGQSSIEVTSTESVLAKVRELKLGKDIERIIEELLTAI